MNVKDKIRNFKSELEEGLTDKDVLKLCGELRIDVDVLLSLPLPFDINEVGQVIYRKSSLEKELIRAKNITEKAKTV